MKGYTNMEKVVQKKYKLKADNRSKNCAFTLSHKPFNNSVISAESLFNFFMSEVPIVQKVVNLFAVQMTVMKELK